MTGPVREHIKRPKTGGGPWRDYALALEARLAETEAKPREYDGPLSEEQLEAQGSAEAEEFYRDAAQEAAGDLLQADVETRAARKATAACAATVDHEIAPVLVVSTAHVTQAEAADFSGALIHAPSDPDDLTVEEWGKWYPNLRPLLVYARSLGCSYVLLDRDADKLPESSGLPTFDW